jgi:hypothetical protein
MTQKEEEEIEVVIVDQLEGDETEKKVILDSLKQYAKNRWGDQIKELKVIPDDELEPGEPGIKKETKSRKKKKKKQGK